MYPQLTRPHEYRLLRSFGFLVFACGQGRIRDSAHVANSLHIYQFHHRDFERATGHPHGPAAERAARWCTRCTPVAIGCPRMDVSETALKEHVKDALRRVAFITFANCWRRLAPKEVFVGLQKMSNVVTYCDVKKYIIDQVGLRMCTCQKRQRADPNGVHARDTSLAGKYTGDKFEEPHEDDEINLSAVKGKG